MTITGSGNFQSPIRKRRFTITFDGTANKGQAATATTAFTATGRVLVHAITTFCTSGLGEAAPTARISLGTTNAVARFVAATDSVDLDTNEWWVSGTPTTGSIDLPDALQSVLVGEDIIIDATVQNTTSGTLIVDVLYEPITDDGDLA